MPCVLSAWLWPTRCKYAVRPILILVFPAWLIVCSLVNTALLVMATHTSADSVVYMGVGTGSGSQVYRLTNVTGTLFLVGVGITLLECAAIAVLAGLFYVTCCCWCRVRWQRSGGGGGGEDQAVGHDADDNTFELATRDDAAESTADLEHNQMDQMIFETSEDTDDDSSV